MPFPSVPRQRADDDTAYAFLFGRALPQPRAPRAAPLYDASYYVGDAVPDTGGTAHIYMSSPNIAGATAAGRYGGAGASLDCALPSPSALEDYVGAPIRGGEGSTDPLVYSPCRSEVVADAMRHQRRRDAAGAKAAEALSAYISGARASRLAWEAAERGECADERTATTHRPVQISAGNPFVSASSLRGESAERPSSAPQNSERSPSPRYESVMRKPLSAYVPRGASFSPPLSSSSGVNAPTPLRGHASAAAAVAGGRAISCCHARDGIHCLDGVAFSFVAEAEVNSRVAIAAEWAESAKSLITSRSRRRAGEEYGTHWDTHKLRGTASRSFSRGSIGGGGEGADCRVDVVLAVAAKRNLRSSEAVALGLGAAEDAGRRRIAVAAAEAFRVSILWPFLRGEWWGGPAAAHCPLGWSSEGALADMYARGTSEEALVSPRCAPIADMVPFLVRHTIVVPHYRGALLLWLLQPLGRSEIIGRRAVEGEESVGRGAIWEQRRAEGRFISTVVEPFAEGGGSSTRTVQPLSVPSSLSFSPRRGREGSRVISETFGVFGGDCDSSSPFPSLLWHYATAEGSPSPTARARGPVVKEVGVGTPHSFTHSASPSPIDDGRAVYRGGDGQSKQSSHSELPDGIAAALFDRFCASRQRLVWAEEAAFAEGIATPFAPLRRRAAAMAASGEGPAERLMREFLR